MSTTRPDNTPTRAAAVHAFTDDGLGKIPNVVIVDANGNSASPTVQQVLPDVTGQALATVYDFAPAAGDVIGSKQAANGQSFTYISIDPLTEDSTSAITTKGSVSQPARVEIEATLSQRVRHDYAILELVSTEAAAAAPTPIALSSIQQATTTLTLVLATAFDGVIGGWINVYGVIDNRLNYCNLCVATISLDRLTLTATVADETALPSVNAGPYAGQGSIVRVDQLLGAPNGYGIRLSGTSQTAAALLTRFGGNSPQAISGAFVGAQTITTGSAAPVYIAGATGQVEIKPTSRFQLVFDPEAVTLSDRGTDNAASAWTTRGQRSNVKPSGNASYKLRFRTVAPKSLTRPVAKIVSAVKAGSTTATITTDVPHGLVTGNYVCIAGIRDTVNFANLTTPTIITVTGANTFTVVMALSATATSYGGAVTLANGGVAQQGLLTQTVSTAARDAAGRVTLVGSAAWSGVNIGDLVNLYGCRVDGTGTDLGLDGVYEVATLATTTMVLIPVVDYTGATRSPVGGVVGTTNAGGCILARTTVRSHDIGLSAYAQCQVQIDGQGTTRADKAMPMFIVGTPAVTLSGTGAVNISQVGGSALAAEDAAATTTPMMVGGVVRAAVPGTTFVAGDAVRDTMTTWGAKVVAPWAVPEAVWNASLALTTTTPAAIQTAAGAGLKRHVIGVQAINTGAAVADLIILDGATERWRLTLPVNVPVYFGFPVPVTVTANTALNANLSVAGTVRANFQGFTAP